MKREPYWPYTTPESKRKNGDALAGMYSEQRADWYALAWLQEHDRLGEWRERHKAWKAAEPRPVDLLPFREAKPLLDEEERLQAKAEAEFGGLWGPLLDAKRKLKGA